MKAILRVLVGLVCMLSFSGVALAQTGGIRGQVRDPSGALIAGAKITVITQGTGAQRFAVGDKDGSFELVSMPVGQYTVEIEAPGFKKFAQKDVIVDIGHVAVVNADMQIGEASTTVTVEASGTQVETTSSQLGAVVNERSVSNLPLSARDTYQLLQLQPGVQSQVGIDLFYGSDKPGVVSVNGGRGRSNNYSVNGGDGNDLFANLPAIQPSPDSIEEFRVLTNTFDAEYGRNSGAVVNVVTKSGTNDFHGDVYEFFRNKVLNARGYLDTIKPDYKQNQFGGTIGGPIVKNKTFFFADYEGSRVIRGMSSPQVILPSAQELLGNFGPIFSNPTTLNNNFTGTLSNRTVATILENRPNCRSGLAGPGQNLLDMAAMGTPEPFGTTQPMPGVFMPGIFSDATNTNYVIPPGCFDPVASDLLRFLPPGGANLPNNVFQGVPNGNEFFDQFSMKIDHHLSSTQQLSAYYFFQDDRTLDPFAKFQAAGGNLGNFGGTFKTRTQQLNISHTWTIGTSAVNEFRFAYFREAQGTFDTPVRTNLLTKSCSSAAVQRFCFTGVPDTMLVDSSGTPISNADPATATPNPKYGITPNLGSKFEGVPFVSVNGGFSIGNNFEGQLPQVGNSFQWSDNYSKVIGKHSLKFGGDFRLQHFDQTLYFDVNGDYTFGTGPVGSSDSYPNYLLGLPTSYLQGSAQTENVRNQAFYLFAQDSWKIRENLTLNYGLRWELTTPMYDTGNRVQVFRPGKRSAIYPCALPAGSPLGANCDAAGITPVGLLVPGDTGVPRGMTQTYYRAFGPRIGLAYSPNFTDGFWHRVFGGAGKTSIRMGYGIFYNPIEQLVLEQFQGEPPFGVSVSVSNPLFSTPYILQSGTVIPNAANGILKPPRGQAVDWSVFRPILLFGEFQPDMRAQYSEQYNLTIQRELPGNILFQAGYVGSQGHRLLATYDINHGNPQSCLDLANLATVTPGSVVSFPVGVPPSPLTCSTFSEDIGYFVQPNTVIPAQGLHLPYGGANGAPMLIPGGTTVGAAGITLVGLRQYSSPLCQPLTGAGCPNDGVPIFSNIFAQHTIANSNYNSLQVLLEKRFSHGLQFQGAYTYSKSIDNASSFEGSLNPVNFKISRGLSQFDSRHRFVLSYFWELPVPKMSGFAGKALNGWATSGVLTFQKGFPIRIAANSSDNQLFSSGDFEAPDEPDIVGKFRTQDPHKGGCAQGTGPTSGTSTPCKAVTNLAFDPNLFANPVNIGVIGSSPRTLCCGPGINNIDIGIHKSTPINERMRVEFRAELFNLFNHTQFIGVQGDFSQGAAFGRVLRAQQPRLMQFALKLFF